MYSTEPLTAGFYGGNKGARQGKARQSKRRQHKQKRQGTHSESGWCLAARAALSHRDRMVVRIRVDPSECLLFITMPLSACYSLPCHGCATYVLIFENIT